MVTIANLVEKEVREKPFVQEALGRGIINHAALAEEIRPLIEKELNKKVKFSAVNAAIRRLSEKLSKKPMEQATFDERSEIIVRSDMVEITIERNNESDDIIKKIQSKINRNKGDFLTITQGINEIMIITNSRHEKKIIEIVPSYKKIIREVSVISMIIPEESFETIGLFYKITRALNWENINIVDIISTWTEMSFILKEDDIPKAFKVLKKIIKIKA